VRRGRVLAVQGYSRSSKLVSINGRDFLVTSDKGGGKCVCPRLSVCLSVCLSVSKITQKRDLDEMLRVDVGTWTNLSPIRLIVRMPEPDCFLRYRISHATPNFTSGKSDVYVLVAAARRGFKMVLRPTAAATRGFTMVSFTEALSEVHALHRVPSSY